MMDVNDRPQICKDLFINCTVNGTLVINMSNEFCILLDKCRTASKNDSVSDPNQPKHVHPQLPTIILVVLILIAVSSFLTNGFMCVVYLLSREIRTAKHYFMVNLFISNGLIAVFGIPFYLTEYMKHDSESNTTLCQIGSMVDVLCCTSSIISLSSISTERFVAVKYPLRYATIVSRKRCLAVLCFLWAYSVAISLASKIPVGKFDMTNCIFFTDRYIIFTTFASFLMPLFAMLLTYGWIYRVVKYQARRINSYTPEVSNRINREFKAAKTITLIIGAFVVSWLPFFCYIWVFSLYKVQTPFTDLHYIIQIVRYLNGLVNPFIYVGINREFRRSTFKLLRRIFTHKQRRSNGAHKNDTDTQLSTVFLKEISTGSSGTIIF